MRKLYGYVCLIHKRSDDPTHIFNLNVTFSADMLGEQVFWANKHVNFRLINNVKSTHRHTHTYVFGGETQNQNKKISRNGQKNTE